MGILRVISESSVAFRDRAEAGELLAKELEAYRSSNVVVLCIPRGGIIVGSLIAESLEADLDIVLSHKLSAPMNPELAIGAVCEDGTLFVNNKTASMAGTDKGYIEEEKRRQLEEISHKVERYRQALPKLEINGKVAIVTDDGVATGATMQAALWAVRQENPEKIVAAIPVGPIDTVNELCKDADETIILRTPIFFEALGRFYVHFEQVEEETVLEILERERQRRVGV